MSDAFMAEIRVFSFEFAPQGWAFCDGQLLPLMQNTALFSLLGTFYGGDGRTTFALPDLRGSVAVGQGQGFGLSERNVGDAGGDATVALLGPQMATHTHQTLAAEIPATSPTLQPGLMLAQTAASMYSSPSSLVQTAAAAIEPEGTGQPHNNLQPFVAMNFCISLQGTYPPRG
jgi:microcystin-dependent protein